MVFDPASCPATPPVSHTKKQKNGQGARRTGNATHAFSHLTTGAIRDPAGRTWQGRSSTRFGRHNALCGDRLCRLP